MSIYGVFALMLVAQIGCSQSSAPPVVGKSESQSPSLAPDGSHGSRTTKPNPPTKLRLATYNINFGNPNLPAVIDAIHKAKADIICLQETNARSAAVLKHAFGKEFRFIRFNGSVRPHYAGGFAVFSRVPIISEQFVAPQHGLFGIHDVKVKLGARVIQILNVHLRPVTMTPAKGPRILTAALAGFSKTEKTHALEITQVLEHVQQDCPVLIVGDFNSLSNGVAPTTLRDRGFVDSFAAANDDPDNHRTWHWRTKYGEIALRIDYIFHVASLQTSASEVIATAGSDHYLLVSQLELD